MQPDDLPALALLVALCALAVAVVEVDLARAGGQQERVLRHQAHRLAEGGEHVGQAAGSKGQRGRVEQARHLEIHLESREVVGEAGHGVAGYGSFLGASIYGASGAAWAGYFDGNVVITGTLDSNNFAGTFASKVDHPLDPANKYLNQSFIESAEMMTVQTGNVTTDANGEANVTLPDYFQAMNGDFRYQLTVVGQFAQAIVGQKIEGNRFTIKTDKPHVEVSWQVTGLRRDATTQASRKPVEELKPESERGHYLRPALFNQPEEKSVEWARHPEMMKRVKAEREQKQTTKRQQ